MSVHMTKSAFLQSLLQLMDNKHHWAWDHFASGRLTHAQLKIHFQQEYAVYVRDFPIFLEPVYNLLLAM